MVHRMDPERKDQELWVRSPFLEFASIIPKFMLDKYLADKRPLEEQSLSAQSEMHTQEYLKSLKRPRHTPDHV